VKAFSVSLAGSPATAPVTQAISSYHPNKGDELQLEKLVQLTLDFQIFLKEKINDDKRNKH